MPTWLLRRRARGLRERMDDPTCDPERLANTYRQFAMVNRLVGGWDAAYRRHLRPLTRPGEPLRLLDLGCGGGDLLVWLADRFRRDGAEVEALGADPDERAIRFARERPAPPGVRFVRADAARLVVAGERFDVVVSNHLLHHLGDAEVTTLCRELERLGPRLVLHNDIRRSDVALALFPLSSLAFRRSFVTGDGLRSIRRSFTAAELRRLAPPGWRVERAAPWRLRLLYETPPEA